MLSLSSLIEFLLDMLRDEATQQDFARDPTATLAARGLSDVTAQDVRDVQPMLADVGGVDRVVQEPAYHGQAASVQQAFAGSSAGSHAAGGGHGGQGGGSGGGQDAVREIQQVAREYVVTRPVTEVTQEYKTYNSFTEFSTDNSVHAAEGATVVQDSYNQDNDGVDNKGGVIDGSTVGGGNVEGSGNDVDTTTVVVGSGDDGEAGTGQDDGGVDPDGGGDPGAIDEAPDPSAGGGDDPDDDGDGGDDAPAAITYGEPYGSGDAVDVNDSYSAQSSSSAATSDGAEHTAAHV